MTRLEHLRVEQLDHPLGLWTRHPRFSWKIIAASATDVIQTAYEMEIQSPREPATTWRTGRVESRDSVLVALDGFEADSATAYRWRVRSWVGGSDDPTPWAESTFETTLLDADDWRARWIEPRQIPVRKDGASNFQELFSLRIESPPEARLLPTPYLRRRFRLEEYPARARLYATAHGIYQAEINGAPVSDELFAPGVESYDIHLSFQTYDVTDHLVSGDNVLGMVLSDGWYAGRVGILGASRGYGDTLKALWQLEVEYADGKRVTITSDGTSVSSTDGPTRYADLAVGECYDARVAWDGWSTVDFDDSTWTPVAEVEVEQSLVPFVGEPVRSVMQVPAQRILRTPAGDTVVDFGQVMAGRVRFRVRGERGRIVRLEHSEVLDENGDYFNNIVGPNKDQTDVYVLAGDPEGETWEPSFTFHGFRYARISGFTESISTDDFTAIVTSSDLPVIGRLETSDERLNRLHANVLWSQRANFLSIPTDCPQRERYGWTGDLQIFAATAATNMAVGPFLSRWLRIVRDDQLADGQIMNISPSPPQLDYLLEGPAPSYDDPIMLLASSAGWGDVIAIAPLVLYQHFADRRVLAENYDAMAAWAQYQIDSATTGLPPRLIGAALTGEQRERQRFLWNNEPNFGDWLAPSTLRGPDASQMNAPRRTGEVIGSLYHGHLMDVMAEIAEVLGRTDDARRYAERARGAREAFAAEYIDDDGRIPGGLQGPYVVALAFDFVPDHRKGEVVDRLVELIHDAADHLDTGFLSVQFLLDVLWDNGHRELARTLLFQETAPSWLYQVAQGATTMWEGWEAIAPDGSVTDLSFNHYAFGCVDDWLYRRVGGIQLKGPGYRESRIEPDFAGPLTSAAAEIDTPYGELATRWAKTEDGRVELIVRIPPNTTSTIQLPESAHDIQRDGRALTSEGPLLMPVGSGEARVTFRLA
ncbi:family 78 glycoside hydrolase catalytic domain [Microbacterium sp. 4R-513]|uniref:alpha-L-rhamnosidase n=1 Tax=Microbacterium sp. 4R-513 TaxID=2567934 RepID=UPI0013E1EED7|nr:alpha-L-rhamnosidase [Microbacterium sp. 4R-513]QIG39450.1 family 78 glycoside hydrolase catalytic domain [Microbacterium sp. 4R-513]